MKTAFYQFDPLFGAVDENLEKTAAALRGASADLLVLPELFASGYQFTSIDEVKALAEPIPSGKTSAFLLKLSAETGMYIAAGLPEKDKNGSFFNSAVLTGPEGLVGVYRKTHLFFEEALWFKPGDTGFRVWDTKIGRIGIMICFDWFFPESARTLALKGAEVIAHPANLVLPYCPRSMPVRCLENRVFAITANRTGTENRGTGPALRFIGQSLIAGPDASILASAPESEDALMTAEIDLEKARNKKLNIYNDLFRDRRPTLYVDSCT